MIHDLDFKILPHLLEQDSFIVDVGANKGQSILSIKQLLPNSIIHSFELNPEFFDHLTSLSKQYDNVTFHPAGLGEKSDSVTFYIPSAGGVRYLEEVSMVLDEYEKPWVKDRWASRGLMTIEESKGIILKGDDFHFQPDLIKIDVEGAESEVVSGFYQTICDTKPILFVENGDWPRLWPILEPLGYSPMMPNEDYSNLVPFAGVRANTFYVVNKN